MFNVGNLCHVNPPSKNYKKIRQGATHNIRENSVGEDYCIPPTFRREHQFRITYFELQIRRGICHRLIRLDSTAPPQGICIL